MPIRQKLKRTYFKAAVAVRRVSVKLLPRSFQANLGLMQALVGREAWQAAIDIGHDLETKNADQPMLYKTLAEAYMGKGDWDAALTAAKQALSLDGENPWMHHTLAKVYIGLEQWPAAIAAEQQALRYDDSMIWFHYHLGEALVKHGDWDAAIAPLEAAVRLDPNYPWSYYYLGDALLSLGRVDAALRVYQTVVAKCPDIEYLQHCLDYAQHLQTQEQRIAEFVHQAQQEDTQGGDRPLRVLMLTPYPTFPPKLGAITRMFYEMKNWGEQANLAVFSLMFSKEDYKIEQDMSPYCNLPIMVMIGDSPARGETEPKLIHRYNSQRLSKLLTQISAANFDIVVADFIYMAQYRHLFPQAFHVLAEHNIESELLRRCSEVSDQQTLSKIASQREAVKAFMSSGAEADLLAAYEDHQWPHFPLRWVVSDLDKQNLDRRCPKGQTWVINNGVDTRQIQCFSDNPNNRILFIGTLSYYPNIDGSIYFAQSILPHIWAKDPTVEFWIAGAEPPEAVSALGNDPRIKVLANPSDMTEVARQCSITIVPLRIGSGTRIKILQSLAMGLPVVSTALGCEGLQVQDGVHLMVRDQPEAFAQASLTLLRDAQKRQQLRQAGRQLVEQTYDWNEIFQQAVTKTAMLYRGQATASID
jgi:glycosyltransferase involved in cell wall biosynthesis/Flp pilus assembly protein TadD